MNKFYLITLGVLCSLAAFAQKGKGKVKVPKVSAAQKATEERVTKIKKAFFGISAMKLQSKAFNYANKCGVKNATITLYYKGADVVKITDVGTGDGHLAAAKWSYQYYYEKGKLIFAFQQINRNMSDKTVETRRYYSGNKLIRKITNTTVSDSEKETVTNTAAEYQLRSVKTEADIAKIYKCG